LEGLSKGGDRTVLWVERKTFLVLQIEEWQDFDNFQTTTATRYRPELDPKLGDRDFQFDPMNRKDKM
jgi:hypothetical protein